MKGNDDKGKKILKAAIKLFSENGFESVKVSDITDEIGIGKGTFYLYYKNKRDLLLGCFEQLHTMVSQLERSRHVRDEKDFSTRMKNRFVGFSEHYFEMIGILHLLRNECNSPDAKICEHARKSYNSIILPLQEDIIAAIKSQEIREVNAELAAYVILGMAESLAFKIGLNPECKKDAAEVFYIAIHSIFVNDTHNITPKSDDKTFLVTDLKSISTRVSNLLFDGKPFLTGFIGDAEIVVNYSKIVSIAVNCSNLNCSVIVSMEDGQQVKLDVSNDTLVTGLVAFGTFKIALNKISDIHFAD